MTDRIEAALAALDKVTRGKWKMVAGTNDTLPCIVAETNVCVADLGSILDPEISANATLIAAAPDLAAEVIRLRKWQNEAVQYLDDALEYLRNQIAVWEVYDRHKVYQSALDDINRLIAEAEEE